MSGSNSQGSFFLPKYGATPIQPSLEGLKKPTSSQSSVRAASPIQQFTNLKKPTVHTWMTGEAVPVGTTVFYSSAWPVWSTAKVVGNSSSSVKILPFPSASGTATLDKGAYGLVSYDQPIKDGYAVQAMFNAYNQNQYSLAVIGQVKAGGPYLHGTIDGPEFAKVWKEKKAIPVHFYAFGGGGAMGEKKNIFPEKGDKIWFIPYGL